MQSNFVLNALKAFTATMAFFFTKSAVDLKSAFEIDKKEIKQEDNQQQQLDDAAAIQKVLFDTEATRPIIEGVIAVTIKSAILFKSESMFYSPKKIECEIESLDLKHRGPFASNELVLYMHEPKLHEKDQGGTALRETAAMGRNQTSTRSCMSSVCNYYGVILM